MSSTVRVPTDAGNVEAANWRAVQALIARVDALHAAAPLPLTATGVLDLAAQENPPAGMLNVIEDLSPELGDDLGARRKKIYNVSSIDFVADGSTPQHKEARLCYDPVTKTHLSMNDQEESSMNIGRESWVRCINVTGVDIDDGRIVWVNLATDGLPEIALARADSIATATSVLGFTTHAIRTKNLAASPSISGQGEVTVFGIVRNQNTLGCSPGCPIYLSDTVFGEWTHVAPRIPSYRIEVGMVLTISETTGIIFVLVTGRVGDIFNNAWSGTVIESINVVVSSNGTTVTATVERDGGGDITANFSDGQAIIDTSPAVAIELTPGSDTVPQANYVYIPISTKLPERSISGWPTEEHVKLADMTIFSATRTLSDGGAWGNTNWNDHVAGPNNMGHIAHISERLRREASWESGAEATLSVGVGDPPSIDLFVAITAGEVYQLHPQPIPAIDTSAGGDIHIVNDPTTPFKTVQNLNRELTDALGGTLSNRYYNIFIFGVINRAGQQSRIALLLPTGSYNTAAAAISDTANYTVTAMPVADGRRNFPIALFTLKHSSASGGVFTQLNYRDMRSPSLRTSGAGGGGGASTFFGLTDTPATGVGAEDFLLKVNPTGSSIEFIDVNNYLALLVFLAGRSGGQKISGSPLITEDLILEDNLVDGNQITVTEIISKLSNIREDLTPQLGATLDSRGFDIDNVGSIIHDTVSVTDLEIRNEDLDKLIKISGNNGGVDTNVLTLSPKGLIGINNSNPSRTIDSIAIVTDGVNATGYRLSTTHVANSTDISGSQRGVQYASTSEGSYDHEQIRAFEGAGYHNGSGTVTNMFGGVISGGILGVGNITNYTSTKLSSFSLGSGLFTGNVTGLDISNLSLYSNTTTTTIRGIYINPNTTIAGLHKYQIRIGSVSGASGDNYAIYSEGGSSYHAGNLGINKTAPDKPLVINTSSNSLSPGFASFEVEGEDNKERSIMTSAGGDPGYQGQRCNGTIASKTATLPGTRLVFLSGGGYYSSAWTGGRASLTVWAGEPFTSTAQGTYVTVETTALGSTTNREVLRINPDGSLSTTNIPLVIDTDRNSLSPGSPSLELRGGQNTERFLITSNADPLFQGQRCGGTMASRTATANNVRLVALGGGGYYSSAWTGNQALISIVSAQAFTSTAQGTKIVFETTLVGTTTRSEKLRINSDGSITSVSGAVLTTGGAWVDFSLSEGKTSVSKVTSASARSILKAIVPYFFKYKAESAGPQYAGYMAEDVPVEIRREKGVHHGTIGAITLKVVQDLMEVVDDQKKKIEGLQAQLVSLSKRVDALSV